MWRALGQGKRLLRLQSRQARVSLLRERHWGGSSFPPLAKSLHSLGNCSGRQSQPALAQRAAESPDRGLLCKAPWPATSRQPSLYLLGKSTGPSDPKRKPAAAVPSFLPVSSVSHRCLYVEDSCSSNMFPEGLYDALVHNEHKDIHHPVTPEALSCPSRRTGT